MNLFICVVDTNPAAVKPESQIRLKQHSALKQSAVKYFRLSILSIVAEEVTEISDSLSHFFCFGKHNNSEVVRIGPVKA